MALPMLRRCCGCFPLETGGFMLCLLSLLLCVAAIIQGSWYLPNHREREQEDNLISMTLVMFATLSAISNIVALVGIARRRPGCLQLSLLFNSVFILCIFLVMMVTFLFSPQLKPYLEEPWIFVLTIILILIGALYSMYYLTIVNSLYRKMKMNYSETALPM